MAMRVLIREFAGSDHTAAVQEVSAEKYPQYRREPPGGPAIALDVAEWRVWAGVTACEPA